MSEKFPSPLPEAISYPRFTPSNLSIFTMRHGERVDQAFGNDWVEQAFKIHRNIENVNKNDAADAEADDAADFIDPPPVNESPKSDGADGEEENSEYSAAKEFAARLPFPFSSLHHCTYVRFNLNMPKDIPSRIPRREIVEYFNDSPLTECGHWQAQTVGESLGGMKIKFIYSSPALRSIQTANQAVLAMGLNYSPDFKGIRIEPALFEYTGWYSNIPKWIPSNELRNQGLLVDPNYIPISPIPLLQESQYDWYTRTAKFVRTVIQSYGTRHEGNILFVGHAGTADVVSYSLLTGYMSPSNEELELGNRVRLFSNYCGVARLKYSRSLGHWSICDDSHFDIHNTSNEPFSFQLTYQSHERQYPLRESQLGFSPARPKISPTEIAFKEDRVIDLNFRRTFGILLDSIQRISDELYEMGDEGRSRLSDRDLYDLFHIRTRHATKLIESIIPEWITMAAYLDGNIAIHVLKCFSCVELLLGAHNTNQSSNIPLINNKSINNNNEIKSESVDGNSNNSNDFDMNNSTGFPLLFSELLYRDKNIFSWALLLHDIGKRLELDKSNGESSNVKPIILRDSIHPFRSAVVAAKILSRQGFSKRSGELEMKSKLKQWELLVNSAFIEDEDDRKSEQIILLKEQFDNQLKLNEIQRKAMGGEIPEPTTEEIQQQQNKSSIPPGNDSIPFSCCGACLTDSDSQNPQTRARRGFYGRSLESRKHDNSKLPRIFNELDDIFGSNSVCVDIIKLILLHQSIPWVSEFPPASPLSNPEIIEYFTPRLLFLSGLMAIVDSASYQINYPQRQKYFIESIQSNIIFYMKLVDPNQEYIPNPNYLMKFQLGKSLQSERENPGSISSRPGSQKPSRRNSVNNTTNDNIGTGSGSISVVTETGILTPTSSRQNYQSNHRPSIDLELTKVGSRANSPTITGRGSFQAAIQIPLIQAQQQ